MIVKLLKSQPDIFIKHAREIEDIKKTPFTEYDFMILRKKHAFEMMTYKFIMQLFKNKPANCTFGYTPISRTVFQCIKITELKLTCEIMAIKPMEIFRVFLDTKNIVMFKKIESLSYFYKMMVHSPLPFVLFPRDQLLNIKKFVSSCYGPKKTTNTCVIVFEVLDCEIILMEPLTAFNFGLYQEIEKLTQNNNICSFFIGFVYQKTFDLKISSGHTA